MKKHICNIKDIRDGSLRIRIGHSIFNFGNVGITKLNAQQKVMEQLKKIHNKGGSFDYVIAYPKDSHPICAVRKGSKPEHFPELVQEAAE
jgi:hypothetical protein